MPIQHSDLKTQIVLAALECSGGDLTRTISFEELLVEAWKQNPLSWGLRGYEKLHPDSERIHRELDSRGKRNKGAVDLGLLEKIRPRLYRLTAKGMAVASRAHPADPTLRERADREMEGEVRKLLEHHAFRAWLQDHRQPTRFRDGAAFWGVAVGSPSGEIKNRMERVENILRVAKEVLDRKTVEEIGGGRGELLFDRNDIERCQEFQQALRLRFASDLNMLGVPGFQAPG